MLKARIGGLTIETLIGVVHKDGSYEPEKVRLSHLPTANGVALEIEITIDEFLQLSDMVEATKIFLTRKILPPHSGKGAWGEPPLHEEVK